MSDANAVKDFYSVLKYPGPDALVTYLWGQRIRQFVTNDNFVFLDAGCGSGRHSAGILDLYPDAKGYCLDFSKPSIEEAKALFKAKGFDDRASLINASYLDKIDLPEPVDIALAIGTIHHTPDPALALKNIAETVKPGGYVACMVYGERGHRRRYEVKEAINLLDDPANGISFFKDYQNTYEGFMDQPLRVLLRDWKNKAGHITRRLLGKKTTGYFVGLTNDIMRSDVISNPIDVAFDTNGVRNLVENAGLEVVNMLGVGRLDPTLLPPSWREGWEALPYWDKVRVIELIDPMPKSWSFICKKPGN